MHRKYALLMTLASFLFLASCTAKLRLPELTAAQLMEKHVAALGGPAALEQLQSWSVRTRVSGDNQVAGSIKTYVRLPRHILVASHVGENTTILAFDGNKGWMRGVGGVSSMDQKNIARLQVRTFLDELLACQPAHCTAVVSGQETIGSVPCHVLKLTWGTGYQTIVYLRATDFLVAKVDSSVEYRGRSIPVETSFRDYRRVGGVLVPFAMQVSGAYGSYTITVESFEPNIELSDFRFSLENVKGE